MKKVVVVSLFMLMVSCRKEPTTVNLDVEFIPSLDNSRDKAYACLYVKKTKSMKCVDMDVFLKSLGAETL